MQSVWTALRWVMMSFLVWYWMHASQTMVATTLLSVTRMARLLDRVERQQSSPAQQSASYAQGSRGWCGINNVYKWLWYVAMFSIMLTLANTLLWIIPASHPSYPSPSTYVIEIKTDFYIFLRYSLLHSTLFSNSFIPFPPHCHAPKILPHLLLRPAQYPQHHYDSESPRLALAPPFANHLLRGWWHLIIGCHLRYGNCNRARRGNLGSRNSQLKNDDKGSEMFIAIVD